MVALVTLPEMPSFKLKTKSSLSLLVGYSLVTRYNQKFLDISSKQIYFVSW